MVNCGVRWMIGVSTLLTVSIIGRSVGSVVSCCAGGCHGALVPHHVAVRRHIVGNGFHKKLVTSVEVVWPPAHMGSPTSSAAAAAVMTSSQLATRQLALLVQLPRGVYVDPYELQRLIGVRQLERRHSCANRHSNAAAAAGAAAAGGGAAAAAAGGGAGSGGAAAGSGGAAAVGGGAAAAGAAAVGGGAAAAVGGGGGAAAAGGSGGGGGAAAVAAGGGGVGGGFGAETVGAADDGAMAEAGGVGDWRWLLLRPPFPSRPVDIEAMAHRIEDTHCRWQHAESVSDRGGGSGSNSGGGSGGGRGGGSGGGGSTHSQDSSTSTGNNNNSSNSDNVDDLVDCGSIQLLIWPRIISTTTTTTADHNGLTTNKTVWTGVVVLPIHGRYHSAQQPEQSVEFAIEPSQVYIRCGSSCSISGDYCDGDITASAAGTVAAAAAAAAARDTCATNVTLAHHMCQQWPCGWLSPCTSCVYRSLTPQHTDEVLIRLPVGDLSDLPLVVSVTSAAVFGATALLLAVTFQF